MDVLGTVSTAPPTTEDFSFIVNDLTPGQHVIALRIADDVGNTAYKSYDFVIEKK